MDHLLVIAVVLAVLLLSANTLLAWIMLHQRLRRDHSDPERGTQTAKVSDYPEPTSKLVLRQFSWSEIESLTGNFANTSIIGEGGFSTVYLASISTYSLAAFKVHRSSGAHHNRELDIHRSLAHPHIVGLLGYSDDGTTAIAFEYLPGGTLHHRLHMTSGKLTWTNRMSIARQLAGAVQYLHEGCTPHIVHADIKAANVLLDGWDDPKAKLCDFGSAQMGFLPSVGSAKKAVVGSPGYVDPYYIRTGLMTKMSDVYSFGVVLLELITGNELPLTAAVKALLFEGRVRDLVVDTSWEENYEREDVDAVVELAARCTRDQPSCRPSMTQVVRALKEKVSTQKISANTSKEQVSKLQDPQEIMPTIPSKTFT